jgi:GNAT superfamily N-acetyltransferase
LGPWHGHFNRTAKIVELQLLLRKVKSEDVERLGPLLSEYMLETYGTPWGGDPARLERHLSGEAVKIILAEHAGGAVGFIAWTPCYDLHWCMKGAVIVDLYVRTPNRGRGVALLLSTTVAKEVEASGGTFLQGGAVESPGAHRLYRRIATRAESGDYYVSGRAFRHFASLAGQPVRAIIRSLPDPSWNTEA